MTWFRLDDTWLTNPKIQAAGLKGRALWVAAGLHCAQHLTDGVIDKAMLPVLAALAGVGAGRKEAATLVALGLWEDHGESFVVPTWAEYQPLREDVEAIREQKQQASMIGNHKRHHLGKGISNPSCPLCLAEASQVRAQEGSQRRTPPDPTRPDPTLSVVTTTKTTNPVDARETPEVVDLQRTGSTKPSDAANLIADYELEIAKAQGVRIERSDAAYRAGIIKRVENDPRFTRICERHPTFTTHELRALYLAPDPLESYDELLRNPTTRHTGHPYAANVTEMGDHTTHNTNGVEKRSQRVGTA
mgnify:FL=1